MADLKDSIIDSIKSLLLPEIRKLQEIANELRIRQDAVEKQMVIMNQNILDNSRRIDETNKKIDAMGARLDQRIDTMGARLDLRIDETNKKIDTMGARLDLRIDETNKKIDDIGAQLNLRIDETNKKIDTMGARLDLRIDYTHIELGNIKKEMERLRREDSVTSDILHRLEIVEERVLLGR